ncbi:MAG TPA: hypothetical protein PK413_15710, partial [Thermoanaerobaculia bacterium]|nr:hypothetical protein [Thermoanaerobaculia bacterium]
MRVGVVAYELEGEATGVGRYLEGLLSGVSPSADWMFRLFCHGRPFEHPLFDRPDVEPQFAGREGRPWLWEQIELPELLAQHSLDLVFSPAYSLPGRLREPGVVTLHDLSFERLPGEFGPRERWRTWRVSASGAPIPGSGGGCARSATTGRAWTMGPWSRSLRRGSSASANARLGGCSLESVVRGRPWARPRWARSCT